MNNTLYMAFRRLGAPFRYRVLGLERLPRAGPAIYIANHLGSIGPVQAVLSLPVRFYPWAIAEMMDYRRAPRYLYDDFVRPELHLNGAFGLACAALLARIAVWLLSGIGSVPVEKGNGAFDSSYPRSVALLSEGKSLLIMPEDKVLAWDAETRMYAFRYGFGLLCQRYHRAVGQAVPVYPMAVHAGRRTILIGNPLMLDMAAYRSQGIRDFCHRAQDEVRALYRKLQAGTDGQEDAR